MVVGAARDIDPGKLGLRVGLACGNAILVLVGRRELPVRSGDVSGVFRRDVRRAFHCRKKVACAVRGGLRADSTSHHAADHLVGADHSVEDPLRVNAGEAVRQCRAAESGRRSGFHAMGGELAGDVLDGFDGNAGYLGVFIHRVLVGAVFEEKESGANGDAVNFAFVFEHTLRAGSVNGGLIGARVDDDELVDRLAVLVLLLGNVHARVCGTHDLAIVGMVLVDDDEMRRVGAGGEPSVPSRLIAGVGEEFRVVRIVVQDPLDYAKGECGVRRRFDGVPGDAAFGCGDASVAHDRVEHVHCRVASCDVVQATLGDGLEAFSVGSGVGAHPEDVFGIFDVRLGACAGFLCVRTRTCRTASSGAVAELVDGAEALGEA